MIDDTNPENETALPCLQETKPKTIQSLNASPRFHVLQVPKIRHPKKEGAIRILCISDTHEKHHKIPKHQLPKCDIVICAGDFTQFGSSEGTQSFCEWFSSLDAEYRVVIAGNHEITFDDYKNKPMMKSNIERLLRKTKLPLEKSKQIMNEFKDKIIYLENESVELYGIKIFGSPMTHYWKEWAFFYPDEKGDEIWSSIPADTDILVTHTCPLSDIDLMEGRHVGCPSLAKAVLRIQPSLHIYGHLHEGYGTAKIGNTKIANVSILDKKRNPVHKPMLFDIIPK